MTWDNSGVGFNFIGVDRDQPYLLPPSLREWLPEDHLAWFVVDAVDQLDLSGFRAGYRVDGRGGAAHDPKVMVGLLVYAYCTGVVSSRKIEQACLVDVGFRVVAGNLVPDHSTISRFRATHAEALAGLFTQVLGLCAVAGLAGVGQVAVDGTKMGAPASLSANRTKESIERQVAELFRAAEEADAAEDELYGVGVRGDELPEGLRSHADRVARLRAAKAVLDARDAAVQAEFEARMAEREAREEATGKRLRGRKPKPPSQKAGGRVKKAKANTTDPDSRVMPTHNGWVQGYNAQAVANTHQVIIAADVTQDTNDCHQLTPMVEEAAREAAAAGVDEPVGVVLADAGYADQKVFATFTDDGPDYYVAVRNMRHGAPRVGSRGPLPADASPLDKMDRKVSRKAGRAIYDQRKWMVEPVFAHIKTIQRIVCFTRRGIDAVKAEWKLIATSHNLLKLYRHNLSMALAGA